MESDQVQRLAATIGHDLGEALLKKYGDFRPQQPGAIAEFYTLIRDTVRACVNADLTADDPPDVVENDDAFVYLTVDTGEVEVSHDGGRQVVKNEAELAAELDRIAKKVGVPRSQLDIYCSSSIDFPHEYTKNRRVRNLCKAIHGDSPAFCGK